MTIEADYLVVGCGAMAMAFVDVLLTDTDATVAIVDRREAPGGHWNDAYPFVRLHQPSANYGAPSKPLGRGRRDETGFNKGFYELATGTEVVNYFHELMRDAFLPSGRVAYYPMSDYAGGEIRSLLSGERRRVAVSKKLVDATRFNTSIPLTHKRAFSVADGVRCIPPNHLPRVAPDHDSFVVLGGGKTALDTITWLIAGGVAPEAIVWVAPRDAWLVNRAAMQPGPEAFERAVGALAAQYEICAAAKSIDEMCEGLEAAKIWLRPDPSVRPAMIHGATVSEAEVDAVRRVGRVVRMGRVKSLEPGRMTLDGGDAVTPRDALYIDCTARALGGNVGDAEPVFSDGRISLQMIRQFQPTFSAALIGRIEASIGDEAQKRDLAVATPMTDTVEQWIGGQALNIRNQMKWSQSRALRDWIAECRLDAFGTGVRAAVDSGDPAKLAILQRIRAASVPAMQNLERLAAAQRAAA